MACVQQVTTLTTARAPDRPPRLRELRDVTRAAPR